MQSFHIFGTLQVYLALSLSAATNIDVSKIIIPSDNATSRVLSRQTVETDRIRLSRTTSRRMHLRREPASRDALATGGASGRVPGKSYASTEVDARGEVEETKAAGSRRRILASALETDPVIPNNIVLNYRVCLHCNGVGELPRHRENIDKNILAKHPGAHWHYYDDAACRAAITRVHSHELATFFDSEAHGPYKSDICRLAMLYEEGGYYFDNDVEVLTDVRLAIPAYTSLSTAVQWRGDQHVFQGFLAALPKHPVLLDALNRTLGKYKSGARPHYDPGSARFMGPETLGEALRSFLGVEKLRVGRIPHRKIQGDGYESEFVYLFKEKSDGLARYNLNRRKGQGCCCNIAIVDATRAIAWSHIIGANNRCDVP